MELEDLVSHARIAFTVIDPRLPDSPIVNCNEHFLELTGYERREVIGKNGRFLAGPESDRETRRLFREAIEQERPFMAELLNFKKDGTPFMNAITVAPIYDDAGDLAGFLASHFEVSRECPEEISSSDIRIKNAMDAIARLTPRQTEVLSGMTAGKPFKQIAYELGLSERTVKMHRADALKSLGVSTNAEAIRIAIEAGCC